MPHLCPRLWHRVLPAMALGGSHHGTSSEVENGCFLLLKGFPEGLLGVGILVVGLFPEACDGWLGPCMGLCACAIVFMATGLCICWWVWDCALGCDFPAHEKGTVVR